MKLHPILVGVVVTLVAATVLATAWQRVRVGPSTSIPGVAIWFISVCLGIWTYRYMARRPGSK